MKIIDRYITREILSSLYLGLSIFILLLVLGRLMDFLGLLAGGPAGAFFTFLLSAIISTMGLALPPSYLFGAIMAMSRLSSDSELVAMEALGVSFKRTATPVLTLGLIVTLIALIFHLYIAPLGNKALQGALFRIAVAKPQMGLREGEFVKLSRGLWISCSSFEKRKVKNIFIYDTRRDITMVITAKKGKITPDPAKQGFVFSLKKGEIHTLREKKYQRLSFKEYQFPVSGLSFSLKGSTKRELTLPQLWKRLKVDKRRELSHYRDTLIHFHKRFALPFSTLVFTLFAISLGKFFYRVERWTGIGIAFAIFLLYYILLSLSQNLAMKGFIPSFLGAWVPNLLLGTSGAYLLWRKSEIVE